MSVPKIIERAMPYSKSGKQRLAATYRLCLWADENNIEGDFVECGVWRGGNVMVMRWASPSRRCWLYDTFAGMTTPGENDGKRNGQKITNPQKWIGKSAVSIEDVEKNLYAAGVLDIEKIVMVPGDVRETLRDKTLLPNKIAVLRLDTDFYDSTKIEMEVLYPRLQSGGYLIVDDYGHWMGARKAIDDYLGVTASLQLKPIDYTGAWMRKP